MSHVWMSHVPYMNESWHTYEWVKLNIWTGQKYSRISNFAPARVMSHVWMSHVTHMNESCHTYKCVMSHVWMSHVTRINESYYTYERVNNTDRSLASYMWPIFVIFFKICSFYPKKVLTESCHTCESVNSTHRPLRACIRDQFLCFFLKLAFTKKKYSQSDVAHVIKSTVLTDLWEPHTSVTNFF